MTIALLASGDPSLDRWMGEEGQELNAIRDAWFRFVTLDGRRRSQDAWERWWRDAGVPLPSPAEAYLLTWNPKRFAFPDLDKYAAQIEKEDLVVAPWSTGRRRTIQQGARVFLMRQGSDNPGMVGVGTAVSEITLRPHLEAVKRAAGQESLMVDVRWTDLAREPRLSRRQLIEGTGESKLWSGQAGGTLIGRELASRLEEMWLRPPLSLEDVATFVFRLVVANAATGPGLLETLDWQISRGALSDLGATSSNPNDIMADLEADQPGPRPIGECEPQRALGNTHRGRSEDRHQRRVQCRYPRRRLDDPVTRLV